MYKKIVVLFSFSLFLSTNAYAKAENPKVTKGETEITLTDGSKKILKDQKYCPCYTYKRVIDLEDVSYYIFDVSDVRAEKTYSILVDSRSGEELKVGGIPVVSPDKKRFVTVTMDLTARSGENSIEVWEFKSPGSIQRTFETKLSDWGPSDPIWVDNTAVRMYKNFLDTQSGTIKESKPFIFLKLKEDKWLFEEDKPVEQKKEETEKKKDEKNSTEEKSENPQQ